MLLRIELQQTSSESCAGMFSIDCELPALGRILGKFFEQVYSQLEGISLNDAEATPAGRRFNIQIQHPLDPNFAEGFRLSFLQNIPLRHHAELQFDHLSRHSEHIIVTVSATKETEVVLLAAAGVLTNN